MKQESRRRGRTPGGGCRPFGGSNIMVRATRSRRGIPALAVVMGIFAFSGPVGADTPEVPDISWVVTIVGETANGATIAAMPPEEDDYLDYMGTEEFAEAPAPANYLWALDGWLHVDLTVGTIKGSPETEGWYSGPNLACHNWRASLEVEHQVKAEGQRIVAAVPPLAPISRTSPKTTNVKNPAACNNGGYPAPTTFVEVPWTSSDLTSEYFPSTWTSTHVLRVYGVRWTSPKGRVVRYKPITVKRTCVVEFPLHQSDEVELLDWNCHTAATNFVEDSPV